jgi:hypothetical protein
MLVLAAPLCAWAQPAKPLKEEPPHRVLTAKIQGVRAHLAASAQHAEMEIGNAVHQAMGWVRGDRSGTGSGASTASSAFVATPVVVHLDTEPEGFGGTRSRQVFASSAADSAAAIDQFFLGAASSADPSWVFGHQPSRFDPSTDYGTILGGALDGGKHVGNGFTGQAAVAHDVEVGLPLSSWAQFETGRYWWGNPDVMQEVHGTEFGLRLSPSPFFQIEAGRLEDSQRSRGFLTARLSIPLGGP